MGYTQHKTPRSAALQLLSAASLTAITYNVQSSPQHPAVTRVGCVSDHPQIVKFQPILI